MGRMFLRPGWLLYVGAAGVTDIHAHHAFQFMISFAELIELGGNGPRRLSSSTAIVPNDAPHAVHRPASHVAILYLDPDGSDGRHLRGLGIDAKDPLAWGQAAQQLAPLCREPAPESWPEAREFAERAVTAVLGLRVEVRPHHPAVRRALDYAGRHLERRIGIQELAGVAGVSASYFSHLFPREVGIPVRPYLRWRRLQRAAQVIARGKSLTEAAFEAGFSDSAHLTHVFRRMFGVTPSAIARSVLWMTDPT